MSSLKDSNDLTRSALSCVILIPEFRGETTYQNKETRALDRDRLDSKCPSEFTNQATCPRNTRESRWVGCSDILSRNSFTGRKDCAIIIEPSIPCTIEGVSFVRKPDAIILKDHTFVLIELKAFEGDIIVDCSRGAIWKSQDGQELMESGRSNPFGQAGGHRKALLNFIKAYVVKGTAPHWAKKDDYAMYDWTARHVHSWVVTGEASRPVVTGIRPREFPSFKV